MNSCQFEGGVKQIVYKLRSVFEKENPKTRLSSKRRGDATSIDFKNSEMNCATGESSFLKIIPVQ